MHLSGAWLVALGVAGVATIGLLLLHKTPLGDLIHQHISDRPRRRMLVAAISFTATFVGLRILTWLIHNDIGPFHNVEMGGRHIHHMVWGILLLLAVGYGWLADIGTGQGETSIAMSRLMSILYGSAAALTLDEFALWLNLRDVYWEKEGRASLDAGIIFCALLFIGYCGSPLLRALAGRRKAV
jgi:hypothetical protein